VKIIKEEEEEEEKDICFLLRITARAPPADCVALFPFWPERDYADILVVHQSFFFFFPSRLHLPFISLQTKCLPKKMGFPYTRKTNLVEEEKLNWLQNVWNSQEGLKKKTREPEGGDRLITICCYCVFVPTCQIVKLSVG
jgi:hypothetical protein